MNWVTDILGNWFVVGAAGLMVLVRTVNGIFDARAKRVPIFGWMSPIMTIWLWHALFDGTPICRCIRSRELRRFRDDLHR